ncbi:MAG: hypothetical protein JXL81_06945 [Deltaproteobacteria bacterium]|nr:hypothetical protein [Deltaproteobacteria bacterium]
MNQKELDNIINAFKAAYREKVNIPAGDSWQPGVMNLIRDESKNDVKAGFFDLFQQFVWRLVPVTCVLVLLLGFLLTQVDFVSDYALVKLFINDPSDLSLFSLYNV